MKYETLKRLQQIAKDNNFKDKDFDSDLEYIEGKLKEKPFIDIIVEGDTRRN